MRDRPLVTVVVPSYNSQKFIEKCLTSILSQDASIAYELIVVDSSNDDTPRLLKHTFPPIKLIHLDNQTLPGAARNIGMREAKGEIIAFIDSDCIVHKNWLPSVVEAINQGYSIVGGAVGNATPNSLLGTADYFMTFNEFQPGMPMREVTFLPTCNFICRKEVFQKIGDFPSDWPAGEDLLFCYKASHKYKLIFNPTVIVYHINRDTIKPFLLHHYQFGKHSAMIRRRLSLLGTVVTRYPMLSVLLPFARFLMISLRIARWNRNQLPHFFRTLPLLILGINAWTYGFMCGYTLKKKSKAIAYPQ